MGTLKLQSNGQLYINTVIGTLAVDGWAVRNVTAHPSAANVPTSYFSMWRYKPCTLKSYQQVAYHPRQSIVFFVPSPALRKKSHENPSIIFE